MPWVRFIDNFDWRLPRVRGHAIVAYKAGMVQLVMRACANEAIAQGKAVAVNEDRRGNERQRRAIPKAK